MEVASILEEGQSFYDLESWKENLRNARPPRQPLLNYIATCYDNIYTHLRYENKEHSDKVYREEKKIYQEVELPLIIMLYCFPEFLKEEKTYPGRKFPYWCKGLPKKPIPAKKELDEQHRHGYGLREFYQYDKVSFEWKDKHKISKKNSKLYKFNPPSTSLDISNEDLKAFYPIFLAKHPDWKKYDNPVIRYNEKGLKKQEYWENFPYPYQMKQQPRSCRELEWFRSLIRIPIVKEPPDPFQKWYPKSPDPIKSFNIKKLTYDQVTINRGVELMGFRVRRRNTVVIPEYGKYTLVWDEYLNPLAVSANVEDQKGARDGEGLKDEQSLKEVPVYSESGDDLFSNSSLDMDSLSAKEDGAWLPGHDFQKERINWPQMAWYISRELSLDPRELIDYLFDKHPELLVDNYLKEGMLAKGKKESEREGFIEIKMKPSAWHVFRQADKPLAYKQLIIPKILLPTSNAFYCYVDGLGVWDEIGGCKSQTFNKNWYYANTKYYDFARKTNDYPEKKYVRLNGKDPTFVPLPYVDFVIAETQGTHTFPYTAGDYGIDSMLRYLEKEAVFEKTGGKKYWGNRLDCRGGKVRDLYRKQ